ncbi:MAG TPA: PAS domain S-box protein, partial [Pyrinomonadaceae bacterium]|nr:PAS domain S-box protein [Pyrinomonadaceae bacterium]
MTIEIAEGQRFPKQFVNTLLAAGAVVLLFSTVRLPFARLEVAPILLMALLAAQVSSRFDGRARAAWHFPFAEGFVFLSMLIFGGEAAVFIAAAVGLCAALSERRDWRSAAFRAAVAAVSAFAVVWVLRLTWGVLTEMTAAAPTASTLNAACIAVVLQSVVGSSVYAFGVSYRINQSAWRDGAHVFLWQLVGNLAAFASALAAAYGVQLFGTAAAVSIGAAACLAATVARAQLFSDRDAEAAQAASDTREKATESDRFRSAFDFAAIGMALVSTEGRWLQVNRSLCSILGYTEKELLLTDFLSITHPDDLPTALSNIGQLLKGKVQASQMEKRYIHKSGHEVWVHWSVSLVRDHYLKSAHLIFQIQDITDRKLAEHQLHHDAFHDALTGLPNRALFMDHLKLAIA